MLALFSRKSPTNPFTVSRNLTSVPGPPQCTANETVAGTGGAIAPCNNEFGILKKSDTAIFAPLIEARPLPGVTWTLPEGSATVQNSPVESMPGLKSCS